MRNAKGRFFQTAKRVQDAVQTAVYQRLYVEVLEILAYYWNTRQQHDLKASLDRVGELEQELYVIEQWHRSMCNSALDAARIKNQATRFQRNEFTRIDIRTVQTENGGTVLGWDLSMHFEGQTKSG